jgi:L-ascorbate metabolism protein UlaG (beta-lactamase superfamily)
VSQNLVHSAAQEDEHVSDAVGRPGTVTWLGHGSVLLTSPSGVRILFDPWLEGNPRFPADLGPIGRIDAIAVTHGHFDHIGSVVPLAQVSGAVVVSTPEMSAYFASLGIGNLVEMNKGGTVSVKDLQLTMVAADHSCGVAVGEATPNVYGGDPVGFIARSAEGAGADRMSVYVSGDTTVFGDMTLIRELYEPELGLFPIDGHYNMGPREAALAVQLLGLKRAVPIHFGTFPVLTGTPEELRKHMADRTVEAELIVLEPGQSVPSAPKATGA